MIRVKALTDTRKGNDAERFKRVTGQVVGRRLTYRNLTGKTLDLSGISL